MRIRTGRSIILFGLSAIAVCVVIVQFTSDSFERIGTGIVLGCAIVTAILADRWQRQEE